MIKSNNYQALAPTGVFFYVVILLLKYAGYDFIIYEGNGDRARGNMLLGNLRDTYIKDDDK